MPYGLDGVWDKNSVITYLIGRQLRLSDSLEEVAQALIKWANELYPEWATWMKLTLPDC